MNTKTKAFLLAAVLTTVVAGAVATGQYASAAGAGAKKSKAGFTDTFFFEDCEFSATGSNRFFILKPNYQLKLAGEGDRGEKVELVITVLDETKVVDGVETRIVEERESKDGALVEVSRNYFAICSQTNSVFYFGEDVDIYEGGKVVNHNGAWLAGKDGARAGLMMPGIVLVGSKYQQETAPGVAMDRAVITSMDREVDTPAGKFEGLLKIRETTPIEPGVVEYKYHAAGIGLVEDNGLKLEEHGFIG